MILRYFDKLDPSSNTQITNSFNLRMKARSSINPTISTCDYVITNYFVDQVLESLI